VEFPAQNWIDYGDGSKGRLAQSRPAGQQRGNDTLMLSLMRSRGFRRTPIMAATNPESLLIPVWKSANNLRFITPVPHSRLAGGGISAPA
jgi:hypothetical protein